MPINHPYLDKLRAWATRQQSIRALVITGSLARADATTDQFSDLDAQLITPDISRYTNDDGWLDALGEVWIRFPLFQRAPYRLVWFKGGFKVDFQFQHPNAIKKLAALTDEYTRGYLVILDKDNLFESLPPSPRLFPQPPKPSPQELQAAINEFWFEAIHVAQFIRRREFWLVKHRDWTMKINLLRMLEWHTRAIAPAPVNTWLLGKRINRWAPKESLRVIERLWPGWDAGALWEALLAQLTLFQRLTHEVCAALDIAYHDATHEEIRAYILSLKEEDRHSPRS